MRQRVCRHFNRLAALAIDQHRSVRSRHQPPLLTGAASSARPLHQLRTICFHHVDNDALLAYSKFDPATGDAVLVVVTLNAFGPEQGTLSLNLAALGMHPYDRFWVRDEVTGAEYQWGEHNFVRLDPQHAVAHIVNLPHIPVETRDRLYRDR